MEMPDTDIIAEVSSLLNQGSQKPRAIHAQDRPPTSGLSGQGYLRGTGMMHVEFSSVTPMNPSGVLDSLGHSSLHPTLDKELVQCLNNLQQLGILHGQGMRKLIKFLQDLCLEGNQLRSIAQQSVAQQEHQNNILSGDKSVVATTEHGQKVSDMLPHSCTYCSGHFAVLEHLINHMQLTHAMTPHMEHTQDGMHNNNSDLGCEMVRDNDGEMQSETTELAGITIKEEPTDEELLQAIRSTDFSTNFPEHSQTVCDGENRNGDDNIQTPKCLKALKRNKRSKRQLLANGDVPDKVLLKCTICSRSFKLKSTLGRHMNLHKNGKMKYKCRLCDALFSTPKVKSTHMKECHADAREHKCPECPKMFLTLVSVRRHVTRVHRSECSFKCEKCPAGFNSSKKLSCHISSQHPTNFKCPHCPRSFHQEWFLTRHVGLHEKGKMKYKCRHCDWVFPCRPNLNGHKSKFHAEAEAALKSAAAAKGIPCPVCSRPYKNRNSLFAHMRCHRPKKTYSCAHCSFTSDMLRHLKRHQLEHPPEIRFKCPQCPFVGSSAHSARVHREVHFTERPFKCSECPESFKRLQKLKNHMSSHGKCRWYKCKVCSYTAKSSFEVNRHRKSTQGRSDTTGGECRQITPKNI